jgi:uncharacterized protein YhaN
VTAAPESLGDTDLVGSCWGKQDPAIAVAEQGIGPVTPLDCRTSPGNRIDTFFDAHRPKGDKGTDPTKMVEALRAYELVVKGYIEQAQVEIASIQEQIQTIQQLIEVQKQKIEEDRKKIEELKERIKELQKEMQQLQEQRSELESQLGK